MVRVLVLVAALLLAGNAYGAECYGKVEFKDTEYGHNYKPSWNIWRKPITADQAEYIKRATVAYLAVPAHTQEGDSAWRDASAAGVRWRDIQVLPMRPIQRKYPEKAYRYELLLDGRKGPVLVHEVVLLVSPAGNMYPNMIPHKKRVYVTESLIEAPTPKRSPGQIWDVRLVITQHWRLAGANPRHPRWPNYRADWRVALCKTDK